MDFTSLQDYTSIGLEGAGVFVVLVIGWKLYKMKCHSRSGCCGDRFMVETMNRAGSSSNLEFSTRNDAVGDDDTKHEAVV